MQTYAYLLLSIFSAVSIGEIVDNAMSFDDIKYPKTTTNTTIIRAKRYSYYGGGCACASSGYSMPSYGYSSYSSYGSSGGGTPYYGGGGGGGNTIIYKTVIIKGGRGHRRRWGGGGGGGGWGMRYGGGCSVRTQTSETCRHCKDDQKIKASSDTVEKLLVRL
ncbi:hypothetical protein WR25_14044 [Diploscapter pachys]|uniref:Uncharacterized protein n=1 Tax=Diploscapter pachys TaxID=2018661 RepID=A0A2A2JHF0_9BILA|nr:hypothetical protein WR25_14044 [Diploscapter pachys]